MVQTPQQRQSNLKFAKLNNAKMGKPMTAAQHKPKNVKKTISQGWLALLAFVVCGGLIVELISRVFLK